MICKCINTVLQQAWPWSCTLNQISEVFVAFNRHCRLHHQGRILWCRTLFVFLFTSIFFSWFGRSHLSAIWFAAGLRASKFLPMFLTSSRNEMKYTAWGEEPSRCLSRGLWNAFGKMFTMPKTRAGFSLAELLVASVTAALVFGVNLQTLPYLYPSSGSDCLRHPCVRSGELAWLNTRINAEMWGKLDKIKHTVNAQALASVLSALHYSCSSTWGF